jgi:hypothetical protein
MARIDWALLCDHAFLDRQDQLSIISIVRSLSAPRLPLAVDRLTLVAHLVDIQPVDEIEVSIGLVTPSGQHAARPGSQQVCIAMAHEYVLATLRDVPLVEEGIHRFQVRLRGQPLVAVDVPVLAVELASQALVQ